LGLTECFFCRFVSRIGGLCFGYIECNQKLSQSDLKLPVAATGDLLWQYHLQGAWRGQALCFHSSTMQHYAVVGRIHPSFSLQQ